MPTIHTETDKSHLLRIVKESGYRVRVIYDVGALHALDGIELAQELNAAELHTFECNPPSIETCRRNHAAHLPPGTVGFICECAITDNRGHLEFHPIDTAKTVTAHKDGNPGASSIFMADGRYPNEKYVQTSLSVETTTLDSYSATHSGPDLIWMDLQGAELLALRGAIHVLLSTRFIHVEVGFRPMYHGQALFGQIDAFLRGAGFTLAHLDLGRWPKLPSLYTLFRWGPWLGNAIYIRA